MRSNSRCSLCLQFALILGAGPVLHRPTSLVIHRLEWNRLRIQCICIFSSRIDDRHSSAARSNSGSEREAQHSRRVAESTAFRLKFFRFCRAVAPTTTSRARPPPLLRGALASRSLVVRKRLFEPVPDGTFVSRPWDPRSSIGYTFELLRPDEEPYDRLRQVPDEESRPRSLVLRARRRHGLSTERETPTV